MVLYYSREFYNYDVASVLKAGLIPHIYVRIHRQWHEQSAVGSHGLVKYLIQKPLRAKTSWDEAFLSQPYAYVKIMTFVKRIVVAQVTAVLTNRRT